MINGGYSKMVSENAMPPVFGGGDGGGDDVLGRDIEKEIELMLLEQEKWMQESSDMIQDESPGAFHQCPSVSLMHNGLVESFETQFTHPYEMAPVDVVHVDSSEQGDGASIQVKSTLHDTGLSASYTYAAALGASSVSRSNTPDPQRGSRSPSPRIPSWGEGRINSLERRVATDPNTFSEVQPGMGEYADLVSAFSDMRMSGVNSRLNGVKYSRSQGHHEFDEQFHLQANQHACFNKIANSHPNGSSIQGLRNTCSPSQYPLVDSPRSPFSDYGLGGYGVHHSSPSSLAHQLSMIDLPTSPQSISGMTMGTSRLDPRGFGGDLTLGPNLLAAAAELQNFDRTGNFIDSSYMQYSRSPELLAAQFAALNNPAANRKDLACSYMEFELQKAYLGAMLSAKKSQYNSSYIGKNGVLDHCYFRNSAYGPDASYLGSPLEGTRNLFAGSMGSWHSDSPTNLYGNKLSSLVDEFKSNKTKNFELAEIAGHVVEFSADQFGSRFIQQKLETASLEEKDMIFHEIMPQALTLMTDVFGNYVVQKFLEHGSTSHIRKLANQLTGHVLSLSLQMYGCRVIQKAIEVAELDQKTSMVTELEGHIMRCVRDQNGNHVIQKCIECVPEDAIQFVVSTFYEQVVPLSTHPYGCRVIQRVLEHCLSPKTQRIMMDEILESVCMLAQDQYGNYVVQHLLQHGHPHERTAIINKLIGQIVQMSQQKFASNVVEKCLTYGTPEERKHIVNEMIGSTDENEPLQVMMKDQFANYVVQKVLETCDDKQLELILSRINFHFNALKKYTYGKHIVARVEKLVAAGEKRISIMNAA